jgi:hypothetical protein
MIAILRNSSYFFPPGKLPVMQALTNFSKIEFMLGVVELADLWKYRNISFHPNSEIRTSRIAVNP